MKIWKNLFGTGDKIHSDNIEVGSSGNHRNLSDSVIVESGSNANGYYVKYGDGTMICWWTIDFPGGTPAAGGSAEVDWTFPMPFTGPHYPTLSRSVEVITGSVALAANYTSVGRAQSFVLARAILVHLNRNTSIAAVKMGLTAIGRWK